MELKNGLRILTIPTKSNSVAVGIYVGVGSRYEDKSNNGISHFLEHMFFKNKELVKRLDCLGAKYNAETSYESTHYYIYGSKNDYEDFIDIISNIYKNLFLDEIQKEKKVILEELRMNIDDSDEIINDEINRRLFNNSNLKLPIIGTSKNIKKFTKKDLLQYYKKYYIPSNTLFAICGNFNEDRAIKLIKKNMENIKSQKLTVLNVPKTIIQKEPKLYHIPDNMSQTNIMITYRSSSMSNKTILYDVIADILVSGCTSKLFTLLRNKLGISYYNYAYNLSYLFEGVFIINVGVEPARTMECIKAIIEELGKLKITQDELDKVIKIRKTHHMLSIDNPLNLMNYKAMLELFNQKDNINILDKLEVTHINIVIKELFDKKNLNIFIHGNKKN